MSKKQTRDYSGKFVVRVPKELHESLVKEAYANKTSLNSLVTAKLSVPLKHGLEEDRNVWVKLARRILREWKLDEE